MKRELRSIHIPMVLRGLLIYSAERRYTTTNANNYLLTENILDLGGKIVASMRFEDQDPLTPDPYADEYYFYHYDLRGSTTMIVKPDGTVAENYAYEIGRAHV